MPLSTSVTWTLSLFFGESISVTAPVVRWVTIANSPALSANTPNGSSGMLARSALLSTYERRCASSHSAFASPPGLHERREPSQFTQAIEGSPRVGMISRSEPPPRSWIATSVAKLPIRTPAPLLMNSDSSQTSVSV